MDNSCSVDISHLSQLHVCIVQHPKFPLRSLKAMLDKEAEKGGIESCNQDKARDD